jgi:predicted nucleotidyltransferase
MVRSITGCPNRPPAGSKRSNSCAGLSTRRLTLHKDFADFLKQLNAHSVRYLVVGGYAVAAHGHPRYTGDLDVFVEATSANAEALVAAYRAFGFDPPELQPALFIASDNIVRLGVEPVRLEVMTSISGVTFADAYPRRLEIELGGLKVPFISYDDLLKNKKAAGRAKDQADVEALRRKPKNPFP